MELDLRLLRSFVAIYECGTLSRAAERLACTQAAMSMRLKLLETESGELLFRRLHHRLEPTPAGADLYGRALNVLSAYDELLSATRKGRRQRLRLGLPDDYALGILPRALERLGTESGYDVEIVCDLSANLAAATEKSYIDLALVTLSCRPPNTFFEAEVSLTWVTKSTVLPKMEGPVPLAAYPEGCVFRRAMINALQGAGKPWRMQIESRTHAGIISAVKAGVAITSMAKGTIPAGLHEANDGWEMPSLPSVPLYLIGKAPTHVMNMLKDEVAHLGGE